MSITNFKPLFIPEYIDEESGELIQFVSSDDKTDLPASSLPEELQILPIKNTVLFPGVVLPITVGRQKSIELVKKSYKGNKIIGVVAQKNSNEDPGFADVFKVGTVAKILKMFVLPDGNTTIIIQGKNRFEITEELSEEPQLSVKYKLLKDKKTGAKGKEMKAIFESLKESANKIMRLNPEIPDEAQVALDNIENDAFLTHFLSSNVNAEVADKQSLLEINELKERAERLLQLMLKDIQVLELKHEIQKKVHTDIDQQQRD